ncbi:MAG: hypothetical protein R3338_05885 [Thermoanaerobaculia bacterium]|nr:hypothetical protein [Thermoanaerobaculia bacterium]
MYTGSEWTIIGLIATINFCALLLCFRDDPSEDAGAGINRPKE